MTTTPVSGIGEFRRAVADENEAVWQRVRRLSAISRWEFDHDNRTHESNRQLADALDGLDLTSDEWGLMVWFLSWDSQDVLASVIRKAREQGCTESFPDAASVADDVNDDRWLEDRGLL